MDQLLPWRVLCLLAPSAELAAVSRFLDLDPDGWQLVAGLWQQDAADGLWRLDVQDLLLLWAPRFEDDFEPERVLPQRRLELREIPFYLEWSGAALEEPELLGAQWSSYSSVAELPPLEGFLSLAGLLRPTQGPRFAVEFQAQGIVRAAELAEACYAAECALGLRRLRGRGPRLG